MIIEPELAQLQRQLTLADVEDVLIRLVLGCKQAGHLEGMRDSIQFLVDPGQNEVGPVIVVLRHEATQVPEVPEG
jgi:hypothetical protein